MLGLDDAAGACRGRAPRARAAAARRAQAARARRRCTLLIGVMAALRDNGAGRRAAVRRRPPRLLRRRRARPAARRPTWSWRCCSAWGRRSSADRSTGDALGPPRGRARPPTSRTRRATARPIRALRARDADRDLRRVSRDPPGTRGGARAPARRARRLRTSTSTSSPRPSCPPSTTRPIPASRGTSCSSCCGPCSPIPGCSAPTSPSSTRRWTPTAATSRAPSSCFATPSQIDE